MFGRSARKPDTVHARASVAIARPPETVMDFLLDPVSAVLIGEVTLRCLHLPDTPARSVGAQFVGISEDGGLLVADLEELVELDYPSWAVTVNRSNPGAIRVTYACELRADGGTDYTQQVSMHPGPGRARALQGPFEAETRRSVQRIKQILEEGEWVPPTA